MTHVVYELVVLDVEVSYIRESTAAVVISQDHRTDLHHLLLTQKLM